MKSLLLAVIALAFSATTYANTCVEDATNQELMDEISRRLYIGDPGPGDDILISATCNSYQLELTNTNLNKGTETNLTMNVGTTSNCRSVADLVNSRLGSSPKDRGAVIAACNSYQLYRVLASTDGGLKQLKTKNLGTTSNCKREADRLNGTW